MTHPWFRAAAVRRSIAVALAVALTACGITHHPLDTVDRPAIVHAPDGSPEAIILALHGFNDSRHAFDWFAGFAAARGYRVEAFDQQGFGTNRNRGLWPGNEALVADLRHRVAELRAAWPDTPLFVLAESMGAAVATIAFADDPPAIDGLVLAAPAVWGGSEFNPLFRAVLMTSASLMPGRTFTGRGLERRPTDNDAALVALGSNPLTIVETRLDAVAGLVRLMDAAVARAPELDVPTLVLFGERDEIIPPDVIGRFVERLVPTDCAAIVYPEGWHFLLRDLQRERVWRDILAWLAGEVPAAAEPCGEVEAG